MQALYQMLRYISQFILSQKDLNKTALNDVNIKITSKLPEEEQMLSLISFCSLETSLRHEMCF